MFELPTIGCLFLVLVVVIVGVSGVDTIEAVDGESKIYRRVKRDQEPEAYALKQRGLWAHRWFFDTGRFPKTVLSQKEQMWWDSLGSYIKPGPNLGASSTDSAIQADLDQLKKDASVSRRRRSVDEQQLVQRQRRQWDDIDFENMTSEELLDLFESSWLDDADKFPATNLTDKQKEYMGLGAYGLKDLGTNENQEDANQTKECTNIDIPAWQRMEWRRLSPDVRQSFVDALQKLGNFNPDSGSMNSGLDIFVKMHRFLNMPGAIRGASLLPQNREYLFRFSNALHEQGYKAALPYWDHIMESVLPDPSDSVIWREDHLGAISGQVGKPFHFITSIKECKKNSMSSSLYRNEPGASLNSYLLLTEEKIESILSKKCYSDLTWMHDAEFESHINNAHTFFGLMEDSQMADPNCAPTDPMFWLHMAFVDLIWEEYRTEKQDEIARQTEYPKTNVGFIPSAMYWYSEMQPFGTHPNIYGLSNHYTTYFYSYEERISKIECKSHKDCDIESNGLLWCNRKSNRCQTKIQENGKCNRDWPNYQCYCSDTSLTPRCKKRTCICK